jgi:transcription antitermination factor NusG
MIDMSGTVYKKMVSYEPIYWHAVYTKSRCEKKAYETLLKDGIEVYVPIFEKTRIYKRKKRVIKFPLIPSYVFVKICRSDIIKVLQNSHVINFVKCGKTLAKIKESEIETLKKVTGEISDIDVALENIKKGDRVEIISGSLVGIKGILLKKAGKRNFSIRLESIGVNLDVQIDKSYLRKVK